MKIVLTILITLSSLNLFASSGTSYEGELLSYNEKEFTLRLADKKIKRFELKYLFSGDLKTIDKLLGKKIKFNVPVTQK